jgi:hypothetical protein
MHIKTYTSIFDEDSENLIQNLINTLGLKEQVEEKNLNQNQSFLIREKRKRIQT